MATKLIRRNKDRPGHRPNIVSSCLRKHRYPAKEEALAAVLNHRWDRRAYAYSCFFCGGWHVGGAPRSDWR
jgi:hypothetical protein